MSWLSTDEEFEYWVELPSNISWENTSWGSEKEWAKFAAETLLFFNNLPKKRSEVKRLSKILIGARQVYEETAIGTEHFLYFSSPQEDLRLSLHISYWPAEGERSSTLRRLARADSPDVVIPPQTEVVETEHLGSGLRSRNHVMLPDETVSINLWYAFRDDQRNLDLVILVSSEHLGRLAAAEPHIDEFVRGVKFVDEYEEV
ncbi:hypothetical protein AB0M87_04080 [Streptomyces sp. NPDC051320]|uniref:hypothetical protein n=1 Tax=Streptomyces sp. NPDC051320 TaxID=3154644 RepID=UPI00343FBC28